MIIKKLVSIFTKLKVTELSLKWETCHLCHWKLLIKLYNDETGVRCLRCAATPISQMLGMVFNELKVKSNSCVYELSSRGAFVRFLNKKHFNLTLSEYFDETLPGDYKNGIQCQNVEKLTYADHSFDICTSLEVFEHVENDIKGFKEIHRVLKRDRIFIFTVPINLERKTIERTQLINQERVHIHEPEYHSDSIRGANKVFCYRNYGYDICQRLISAGFKYCEIKSPQESKMFGYGRPVIIAKK